MCPASISQQMFLLLLSLLTSSEKSREGLDLQETSWLSNFQHKLFQERMSQAYALPRLWLAKDGLQPPWYAPDFTPAMVRQHKILSMCLGEFLLREKGAIKLLWQVVVNLHENSSSISEHGKCFYSSCARCLFQFFCINSHLFRTEFIHGNSANFSKKHELLEKPKMMIY